MSDFEFPVTRFVTTLFETKADADNVCGQPSLTPVHIPGAEFYRGYEQRRAYGVPGLRPTQQHFSEAMRCLAQPLSDRAGISRGAAAFLCQINDATSFLVSWGAGEMESYHVHVGTLMTADKVLQPRAVALPDHHGFSPERWEQISTHNKKYAAYVNALRDRHYVERENFLPAMNTTLANHPIVVRADNTIVIPREGDYFADFDGYVFAGLKTCRIQPTKGLPESLRKGAVRPCAQAYELSVRVVKYDCSMCDHYRI